MANTTVQTGPTPAPEEPRRPLLRHHHVAAGDLRVRRGAPEVVRHAGADDARSSPSGTALPMTTEAGKQAALDQQVTQMESFGMHGQRPDVRADAEAARRSRRTRPPAACSSSSPIIAVDHRRHPVRDLQRRDGRRGDVQAGVRGRRPRRRRSRRSAQLFTGPLNYFRGSDDAARPTWRCCCRCSTRGRSSAGCSGMIDLFLDLVADRAGDRPGRALPPAHAADRDRRCSRSTP